MNTSWCRALASGLMAGMVSACSTAVEPVCPYQGEPDFALSAGCLTVVHGRMLVVDSRAGGLTPPGGKSRQGESAQCTAHRETLEETGLDLIPRRLLAVFDTGFHLYSCEIHANSGTIDPAVLEVRRAFWLEIAKMDEVQWRYPGQGEIIEALLTEGPDAVAGHPAAD
ncbi:NUDIX hydrolase [Seongchinamella sediminis]|uniref:NUDIX hydrolase n=1 Tax=Seongchinamella sediminis TaxID=2283635 RepID=UPI0013C316BA|nr:NUDIX domain-containing protein [Seongchinamella sediminis]